MQLSQTVVLLTQIQKSVENRDWSRSRPTNQCVNLQFKKSEVISDRVGQGSVTVQGGPKNGTIFVHLIISPKY